MAVPNPLPKPTLAARFWTVTEPRLAPLAPPNLSAEQQELYDAIAGGRRAQEPRGGRGLAFPDGSLAGPFNAYLYTPGIGAKLQEVGAALRFDTSVPRKLAELAIIVVGRTWTAQFEWFAHSRMAAEAGISQDVIDAIAARREPAFSDNAEATVYRFASQLCAQHQVDDATYAAASALLGDRGVVELTMVIGYYNYVSAMLNTFQVPLPEGAKGLEP